MPSTGEAFCARSGSIPLGFSDLRLGPQIATSTDAHVLRPRETGQRACLIELRLLDSPRSDSTCTGPTREGVVLPADV